MASESNLYNEIPQMHPKIMHSETRLVNSRPGLSDPLFLFNISCFPLFFLSSIAWPASNRVLSSSIPYCVGTESVISSFKDNPFNPFLGRIGGAVRALRIGFSSSASVPLSLGDVFDLMKFPVPFFPGSFDDCDLDFADG